MSARRRNSRPADINQYKSQGDGNARRLGSNQVDAIRPQDQGDEDSSGSWNAIKIRRGNQVLDNGGRSKKRHVGKEEDSGATMGETSRKSCSKRESPVLAQASTKSLKF